MKRAAMILAGVLLPMALLAGCGSAVTQTYHDTDFTRVEVGHAFRVNIIRANLYSVSITAPQPLFDAIRVTKEGGTLKIGLIRPMPVAGARVDITMPDLRGLDLSGAARGMIKGFSSPASLDLELSGASALNGDIKAGDTMFRVSGASKLELEGSSADMVLDISGASGVNLSEFPADNARVELSGASNGTINVSGRLDADLSGASKLTYLGGPTLEDINISGGATLKKG